MAKTGTQVKIVPIAELIPDPSNARRRNSRAESALATSVKELGAGRSVVIDRDGVIRAGNGTLEAAKAAGISEAIVIETDGRKLVVVKRPDWTAEQALAYAISDNRTNELSYFDVKALSGAISKLAEHAIAVGNRTLLDTAGFNEKELEALLTLPPSAEPASIEVEGYSRSAPAGEVDAKTEWGGMPGYEHEDKRAWRSIVVHFKDESALEEFEKRFGVQLPEKARYLWFPEIEIGHFADKSYKSES